MTVKHRVAVLRPIDPQPDPLMALPSVRQVELSARGPEGRGSAVRVAAPIPPSFRRWRGLDAVRVALQGRSADCTPPMLTAAVLAMVLDSLAWVAGYLWVEPPGILGGWSFPVWFALVAGLAQVWAGQLGIEAGHRPLVLARNWTGAVSIACGASLLTGHVLAVDWPAAATMSAAAAIAATCTWPVRVVLGCRRAPQRLGQRAQAGGRGDSSRRLGIASSAVPIVATHSAMSSKARSAAIGPAPNGSTMSSSSGTAIR